MRIIRDLDSFATTSPTALVLGNFDGFHVGHKAITDKLHEVSKKMGLSSSIVTFEPHPMKFFGADVKMIMTERAKIRAFEEADVENMFIFTFSRTFAEIDPEVFVREFLVKKLRAAVVIVGYDYHFGRNRSGDFDLLVTLGNKYGFTALRVPKVTCDGETVSSTNIRKFLADGNVEKAGKFLGRPFFVEGEVVKGDGVGRQLGFPTANVDFGNELIPKAGVYVSIARFEGRWLPSATSIGKRPTFNFPEQMKVETYIFDFNESIYGKHMEVDLLHYLREEIKFPSKEALIEAIEQDCLNARNYFKKKLP